MMTNIREVKLFLHSRFRMEDLGAALFLLGTEIRKQPYGDILLVQEKYARELLHRYEVDISRFPSPLAAS